MGLYPNATLTPAAIVEGDIDAYSLIGDALTSVGQESNVMPGKTVLVPNERREGYDWSQDSIDPREGGAFIVSPQSLESRLEQFKQAYADELAQLPPHEVAIVFAAYVS